MLTSRPIRPLWVALASLVLMGPSAAQRSPAPNTVPPPITAPPITTPSITVPAVTVSLSAGLEGDASVLRSGLVWRVYADNAEAEKAVLVRKTDDPAPVLTLDPGAYIVHVTWGLATGTRRVVVGQTPLNEKIMLSAGGLRLGATLGDMHHAPQLAEENCHGHAMKGDALASDTHASSPADGDLQHHCCPGHVLGHLQAGLGQALALPLPRASRATVDRAETAFSSRAPDGLERPPRHAA